jgi:hypothetical protein
MASAGPAVQSHHAEAPHYLGGVTTRVCQTQDGASRGTYSYSFTGTC